MRTRAQAALDKQRLWREINRDHGSAGEALASLRARLRDARLRRKLALRDAKERCRRKEATRVTCIERPADSDDKVRGNIPAERSTSRTFRSRSGGPKVRAYATGAAPRACYARRSGGSWNPSHGTTSTRSSCAYRADPSRCGLHSEMHLDQAVGLSFSASRG